MAYSSPATVVTATTITSAWGNSVKAGLDYQANPPVCRVTHTAAISIPNAAWTVTAFDTEVNKTVAGMHSNVTNNSRITIPDAGWYHVEMAAAFASNATGSRGIALHKNGAANANGGSLIQAVSGDGTFVHYSVDLKLAAADYLETVLFQRSGGALLTSVTDGLPVFSATWIGLG